MTVKKETYRRLDGNVGTKVIVYWGILDYWLGMRHEFQNLKNRCRDMTLVLSHLTPSKDTPTGGVISSETKAARRNSSSP